MKVSVVGLKSTPEMRAARCYEMTPELLAAVGARYSRNGEGLDAIFDKVQGMDAGDAVASIFKNIDYGHQSIADMVPVAMFIDRVSMYLVMRMWQWSPTASGQESSTRYIRFDNPDSTLVFQPDYSPSGAEDPAGLLKEFQDVTEDCFDAYVNSLEAWTQIGEQYPELLDVPAELLAATDSKSKSKVDRIRRNFAFDRSRYFLPLNALTNVMMIMPARGWVQLIRRLASWPYNESKKLAAELREALQLVSPNMVKHATFSQAWKLQLDIAIEEDVRGTESLVAQGETTYQSPDPQLGIAYFASRGSKFPTIERDCKYRTNRYDLFGMSVNMLPVTFGWGALPIGEARDLNRHRTGTKDIRMVPVGGYFAHTELEKAGKRVELSKESVATITSMIDLGYKVIQRARTYAKLTPDYVYCLPLGTQIPYYHTTTADRFLYQCELRTGMGAHPEYAARMREVLELWHQTYPGTRELVRPGTAEPE